MKSLLFKSHKAKALLLLVLLFSIACSSNDPSPTTGTTSVKTKGRLLIGTDTATSLNVLDLEQSAVETQSKTFSKAPVLLASPEGNYAFVVQSSGNKVNILKMGASVSTTATTTTSSTTAGHEGHSHKPKLKPRYGAGHDHGAESTASSSSSTESSSTSSTSSVETLEMALTGENLGISVSKGKFITFQFKNTVSVVSEENLEKNTINEKVVYTITSTWPGVPMDSEHLAIGGNVVEIADGASLHSAANTTVKSIVSSNVLSATRAAEGVALFGTKQGVVVVKKHTESGNLVWEDFIVNYPEVPESQIFLAEGHTHAKPDIEILAEEEHSEDEHKEVEENRAATGWATHDALGHAFVHLTHENHSAGVYLMEIGSEEENEASKLEYLADTSSSTVRPVALDIAFFENSDHVQKYYLLILMSNGDLRIHDAKDEGKFLKVITGVTAAVTDFHAGEGNYPGLSSGLGKVYVGNPSTNQIHQIDLTSYTTELTWSVDQKPNQLLLLGQSTLSTSTESHDH